jgi:hypothetical protein
VTGDKSEADLIRAAAICRDVAELPDRTSPDENADFMLVTADELQPMLAQAFADLRAALASPPITDEDVAQLMEDLQTVASGAGPFSRDPLKHAENCIELAWQQRAERLEVALQALLSEWDKLSRYGSPLAKSGNAAVNAAREALSPRPGAGETTGTIRNITAEEEAIFDRALEASCKIVYVPTGERDRALEEAAQIAKAAGQSWRIEDGSPERIAEAILAIKSRPSPTRSAPTKLLADVREMLSKPYDAVSWRAKVRELCDALEEAIR